MTKNLNWQILTTNLVNIKRQDGVKDEKLLVLWEFTNFQGTGGVTEKNEYGELPKKGGLDNLQVA